MSGDEGVTVFALEWPRPEGDRFSRAVGRREESDLRSPRRQNAPDARPDRKYPQSRRIRRRTEYLRIQSSSRGKKSPHFIVICVAGRGVESRLGVTASRRVGTAVERNRIKRRVREFFRLHRDRLQPAHDLLIIARAGAEKLSYKDVESELAHALGIRTCD
jgi:ribonuclease P protein component